MKLNHCSPYLDVLNSSNQDVVSKAISAGVGGNYKKVLELLHGNVSSDATFLRGLSSLKLGDHSKAKTEFEILKGQPDAHFLIPAFVDHLNGTKSESEKMYGGSAFSDHFAVASTRNLFRDMYQAVDNTLSSFTPDGDTFTLMDVGIGTGVQVDRVIKWIPKAWPQVKAVKVIAIDPSPSLIEKAKIQLERTMKESPLDVSVTFIESLAQNVSEERLREALEGNALDVVNACASIHHMPQSDKLILLKKLKNLAPKILVVTDADSDHESTLADLSFELVANATSFYSTVLQYLLSEPASKEEEDHLRAFCFFDARNVLLETGKSRIEYHTTAQNWVHYLSSVGFRLLPPRNEWINGLTPGRAQLGKDFIHTAVSERPINFQLVATGRTE